MDILKKLSEKGYTPYDFTDFILVEIYNKLCDIERKIESRNDDGQNQDVVKQQDANIEQETAKVENAHSNAIPQLGYENSLKTNSMSKQTHKTNKRKSTAKKGRGR